MILVVDEVAGAYIAWGERAHLQITQAKCCYVETDECEEVPTEVGWEGTSLMGTHSECYSIIKMGITLPI